MGRKKKYLTEEERKKVYNERMKEFYQKNKEKIKESRKNFRKNNKDKIKKYYLDNKDKKIAYSKKYYQENKEKILERLKTDKNVRKFNREHKKEYNKAYNKTPNGRAVNLLKNYNRIDKNANRGECTLSPEWIIENIFSGQKCVYCGEDDWTKLGCDRIDNDKPHTPDNVVCCCRECNVKRNRKTYDEFIKTING